MAPDGSPRIYLATTRCYVRLPGDHLHAIHVGAGLLALLGAAALAVVGASWDSRRIAVDVTAWYCTSWLALVYLFGLVALMNS